MKNIHVKNCDLLSVELNINEGVFQFLMKNDGLEFEGHLSPDSSMDSGYNVIWYVDGQHDPYFLSEEYRAEIELALVAMADNLTKKIEGYQFTIRAEKDKELFELPEKQTTYYLFGTGAVKEWNNMTGDPSDKEIAKDLVEAMEYHGGDTYEFTTGDSVGDLM